MSIFPFIKKTILLNIKSLNRLTMPVIMLTIVSILSMSPLIFNAGSTFVSGGFDPVNIVVMPIILAIYIKMLDDLINGIKPDFKEARSNLNGKFLKLIGAQLIAVIAFQGATFISAIIISGLFNVNFMPIGILSIIGLPILLSLVGIIFSFAIPGITLKNLGVVESIKYSVGIFKGRFISYAIKLLAIDLIRIFLGMSIIFLGALPLLGIALIVFVDVIMETIRITAVMILYQENN